MTTVQINKKNSVTADLFPQNVISQIKIKEVQENASYIYGNKYSTERECSNIAINLEYKGENLWVVLYYGIGYRDGEAKSKVVVIRDREFQEGGDNNPSEILTPSVYYWETPLAITKEQEIAAELSNILDNHIIQADENSSEALCEENNMFIEDAALTLRDIQNVVFDTKLNVENITLKQIKDIEKQLERAKEAYRESEGKKLLNEMLEDNNCPPMLKDLSRKLCFTSIFFEKLTHNEDYMPDFGKYIVFKGMVDVGPSDEVSMQEYNYGFLFEESETYVINELYENFEGKAYLSESDFEATIKDDEVIMDSKDWSYEYTEEAYLVWNYILRFTQEGYKRELFI